MRLQSLFHFSFYLTLALAGACLTLPSVFFLWWMPLCLGAAIAFFYLAWRYEGVWVLSETAANQIGVFIAVGAAGWILFQVPRSVEQLAAGGVNWPAGLLPHLGPLLMILLIVKLFRPKRLPDYWVIQTMGLMMVALAAVLADERGFGILMTLYFVSLVWSLATYYLVRERVLVASGVTPQQAPLFGGNAIERKDPVPWSLWGVPRATLWTMTVALFGLLLFLCAPRQGQTQWNARQLSTGGSASSKTGAEAGIDLNRIGYVELSDDPAFNVTVRDSIGQVQDPANIRHWRQETLEVYSGGRWYPQRRVRESEVHPGVNSGMPAARPAPEQPAHDQWLITFEVKPSAAGGLVLAEPVDADLGIGLDPRIDNRLQSLSFFSFPEGFDTFVASGNPTRNRIYSYSQVVTARGEQRLTPARGISEAFSATLAKYPAPPALTGWTRELLLRLPGLNDDERRLNDRQQLDEQHHARVAEALSDYLTRSGEYRYTLELRRKDTTLDATVDFLINVKEGHCERFAGGLALMLRSLGVRCRVVKGYLGGELDESGHGIVRKSHAHTWVQALVPGERPGELHWLTLDPSPLTAAPDGVLASWWNWFNENLLDSRIFWRQFIVEYAPEQQLDLLDALREMVTSKRGWLKLSLLAVAGIMLLAGPRLGRRLVWAARQWWNAPSRSTTASVPFFAELLRLLHRYGPWLPEPGQTPREFAAQVAGALETERKSGDIAGVPCRVVDAYYQVWYGGRPLDAAQRAEIDQLLSHLRTRLAK